MRDHSLLLMVGSLLLTLGGCAAESAKPASETPPPPPIAQAEGATDQPPSGEVQERGVQRLTPGLTPSAPLVSKLPAGPLSISALPGHFAFETFGGPYFTAVGGGGRTTDVVRTDAASVGPWELYRLFLVLGSGTGGTPQQYAIQTASFNFLTAVDGGGRTSDVLHTDATQVQSWETFKFVPDQYGWRHAMQTVNGHYLTAVGAGGKTTDAVHTDAVKVGTWEEFYIWKCGDLASGYQYTISAASEPYGIVFAYGGGGRVATHDGVFVAGALGVLSDYNLRPAPFDNNWQKFRLMRQGDGSYGLLTSNGVNYVTAIQGGGLASGTKTYDDLVTDRTQVQAWEKFRFIEQGNCTYVIQTASGQYLGKSTAAPGTALGVFSTNVSDIKSATKFRLAVVLF
jgi:hypothetical protein